MPDTVVFLNSFFCFLRLCKRLNANLWLVSSGLRNQLSAVTVKSWFATVYNNETFNLIVLLGLLICHFSRRLSSHHVLPSVWILRSEFGQIIYVPLVRVAYSILPR